MKRVLPWGVLLVVLALTLAACGGSGQDDGGDSTDTGTGTDTEVINDPLDVSVDPLGSVQLIRDSTSAATVDVSSAEPATVVVTVSNISEPVVVEFTSTIGNLPITTALTDNSNQAKVQLLADTTLGAGTVTASVNGSPVGSIAFRVVSVAETSPEPAVPNSIVFQSATPQVISIAGTGGVEQSIVSFQVVDNLGSPVEDVEVSFSLVNTVGGVGLVNTSGSTNSVGVVQTTITAGAVATTVTVEASIVSNTALTARSSQLSVSTGIADQNSMTVALSTINIEGLDHVGETSTVTVRLADHFNNPVPDGTTAQFRTEGGAVEPQCLSVSGVCSVTATSQEPYPQGLNLSNDDCFSGDVGLGNCAGDLNGNGARGGRVSILAFATGEESFFDSNSNGLFDTADEYTEFLDGDDVTGQAFDLPEAYVDFNENGVFDPGIEEEFVDFDGDATYDAADLKYNGSLCSGSLAATNCGDPDVATDVSTNVRRNIVLVFSGSGAYFTFPDLASASLDISGSGSGSLRVTISDRNGNVMPAGTTVEFSANNVDLTGVTSFTVFNGTEPSTYVVGVARDTDPSGGTVSVIVTTPKGIISSRTISVTE